MSNFLGSEAGGENVCPNSLALLNGSFRSLRKPPSESKHRLFRKSSGAYADWVIVALHGLREYLGQSSRTLLAVLHEMPRIVSKLDLAVAAPRFHHATRMQDLEMTVWWVLLRLLADLHDFGELQDIDLTSYAYRSASQNSYWL